MFPPVAAVARTLSEDCEFEGHKFVEGTWMVTDIHAIHHNPSIWEDPEVLQSNINFELLFF